MEGNVLSNSDNLPFYSLEKSLPLCSLKDCSVIYPVCLDPILEATDKKNGWEAFFCENICKQERKQQY